MKTRGLVLIAAVVVLMSGCTAPVFGLTPKPIDTLTNTTGTQVLIPVTRKTEVVPTATFTPTETVVPTETPIPTPTITETPKVYYTDLGIQANIIAKALGWTITVCDQETEDISRFLYTKYSNKRFCDFEGHMQEPVPNVMPEYILILAYLKGYSPVISDGLHFALVKVMSNYYPYPSLYDRDTFARMHRFSSYDEQFKYKSVMAYQRAWPLTTGERFILQEKGVLYFELFL